MAFIPALNTAKVTVNQRMHGQVVQNVYYVRSNVALDEAKLTAIGNAFINWYVNNVANVQSTDVRYESVNVRDMTVRDGLGLELAFQPNASGNIANQALPGNVALAVKHITAYSGRSRRGRTFLAGLSENSVEGNEVTLAIRDAIITAFNALLPILANLAVEWVVASFFSILAAGAGPNGARPTALLTPVTQSIADINIDSQRRRLNGRGQ